MVRFNHRFSTLYRLILLFKRYVMSGTRIHWQMDDLQTSFRKKAEEKWR